jgi:toxin ParE1/3/4
MKGRIVRKPRVRQDLKEHFLFIGQNSLRSAQRFLKAAENAFAQLARVPELGSTWETQKLDLIGLRVWPIPRFRSYLVFYRTTEQGIEIVRVLHAARDLESAF